MRNGYKHSDETKRKIGLANAISKKGSKLTEEHKAKISASLKGRPKSPEARKNMRGFTGKHSEESKRAMSLGHVGRKQSLEERLMRKAIARRGEKNNMWKGGVTTENARVRTSMEYKLWREGVFARDNWTCQDCKSRGGIILHADHIKPFALYPELRFALDNGRTLCADCHKKTPTYMKSFTSREVYELLVK